MRKIITTKTVSVEEDVSGKKLREIEQVYYGKITTEEYVSLKSYDSELQEQYAILKPSGTIRIRRKEINGADQFIQTMKTWEAGVVGKDEAQHEVSADEFAMFKRIADSGFYKRRYFIPVNESLKWEVDAILNHKGEFTSWVKVDLEVPDDYTGEIPNHETLPFTLTEAILSQFNTMTEEERVRLKTLQTTVFDVLAQQA
jgi:hypothetical protein